MIQFFAQTGENIGILENVNYKNKDTAAWEILIMLLGAFLLGYVLKWLLCRAQHSKRAAVSAPSKPASVAPAAAVATKPAASTKPDDLTIIEGIGPKINQLLQDAGIKTYRDLAGAAPSRIKGILDDAGPRYKMHDPATWPKQSALAAAGRMDELEALKDRLSGGK